MTPPTLPQPSSPQVDKEAAGEGRRIRRRRRLLVAAIVLLAHLAGALTSIRALMEVRTAQGTIAWVVSLNTLPYVAVPAFWVFGLSKFEGYVLTRKADLAQTDPTARRFLEELMARDLLAFPDRDQALPVEKLAKLPFTQGNDAELLIDGQATFDSILAGIDRAQHYALVQFYILRDDGLGRRLKDRLIERARAGVRCYLLYDEVGNRPPRAFLDELAAGGVRVLAFNTTQGDANRFQLNFRNHRKIVVVDGREAWVGGLNVGDEYLGLDPEFGFWRDTHLRVEGPVAQCVQVSFLEDWHWASSGEDLDLDWSPRAASSGVSRKILSLPSGPADALETCTLFFVGAINKAEKRLWIASPYFVPDEQFITALQLAALRGVDVRILVPDRSDNLLVQLSGWSYLGELESVGIRVWRYTKGFMHHKVVVIDERYCTIGTANFDNRSFRLNFEITLAVDDADFTAQVAAMLEQDFAAARPATKAELDASGFWYRLAVRAARLMAPVQ